MADLYRAELQNCGFSPAWIGELVDRYGPRLAEVAIKAVREHGFSAAAVEDLLGRVRPLFLEVLIGLLDDTKRVGTQLLVEGIETPDLLKNEIVKVLVRRLLDEAGPRLADWLAKAVLAWIKSKV